MSSTSHLRLFAPAVAALLLCSPAPAETARPAHPPFVFPNSEVRVLPRNAAGRQYQLNIGLPESYGKDAARRYPVVYVTDGYWDFQKMTEVQGCLAYDKYAPEFITVAIAYAGDNLDYGNLRRWELSPVPFLDKGEASGHAADFLRTIRTEIIPLVEREYRADPAQRVLAGASLGGLFTLYAMFTEPDLFQGYVAATPAVGLANDWLIHYGEKFAASGRPIRARLFFAVGGNESPAHYASILRFNRSLTAHKVEGLTHEFRVIEGERHAGMQNDAYTRGLAFVFAPVAPDSGPAPDWN